MRLWRQEIKKGSYMRYFSIRRRALLVAVSAVALSSTPALGQEAAKAEDNAQTAAKPAQETMEEVLVTGSRIRQRGVETASPLQVITAQDLDARGFQTVAQALNELPAFGIPGASPVGAGQSSFGAGQSFVNFLGLGSQRTLTLVNGRRFVSSNTSSIFGPTGSGGNQVDLNVIPTKLIDRIETVAAIGAPIYGSDAIAGTINLILKRNFEGFDVDVQSGFTSRGDAPNYRIRALAGKNFAGGRGNIIVSGEYNQSTGLLYTDREVTTSDDRFDSDPNDVRRQIIYRDLRVPSIATTGIPLVGGAAFGLDFPLSPQQAALVFGDPTASFGVLNGTGQQLRFNSAGGLEAIDFGGTIGPDDGFSVFTSGGNGFSLTPVQNLLTDVKRYSINSILSFEVSPNFRLFGEAWYTVSEGRNLASQPAYNSGLFDAAGTRDGNLIIPVSNPFLTPQARAAILDSIANNPFSDQNFFGTPQDYFYLGRANFDLSPGVSTGSSQVLRFVGGVEGNVSVLPGKQWHFEAFFNYGRSLVRSRNPELNQQNFLNAVNAVRDGSGTIVCAPGAVNSPIATLSSTCAPLNLFGTQVSAAARDYVTTIATPRNVNNQYDAVASISGPLFALPGGDLSFALGYEHRAEDSTFDPGAFYFGAGAGDASQRTSYGRSTPIDPVRGGYYTNEIFGELNAAIISEKNEVPFVHELTFQTAGRYIFNSQAGNDPTYTFQMRYAPVRDITFRGAYTRAVRAPSVTEAFNPRSTAFGFAVDPCDRSQVGAGPDPATRTANCQAAGVPANFVSLSNQRSIQTFTFGNTALTNERSDSFTAGFALTPTFFRGFNLTADYVDITLRNAISQFSNTQVVSACYDATDFPNNQFCGLVTRDPGSFQLTNVGTTYFNSAQLRYKGILADASYRTNTDFLGKGSRMSFRITYQYLDTLSTQSTAGAALTQTADSIGYSRHKGVGTVGYETGGFNAQVQVNYQSGVSVDTNPGNLIYSVPRVGSFTYVNLSLSQNVGRNFTLSADVDNLFNARPPFPFPASGGVNPYFQGVIGTYVRVGASVHF